MGGIGCETVWKISKRARDFCPPVASQYATSNTNPPVACPSARPVSSSRVRSPHAPVFRKRRQNRMVSSPTPTDGELARPCAWTSGLRHLGERSRHRLPAEHQPRDPCRRLFLHRWDGVRVGVERDRGGAWPRRPPRSVAGRITPSKAALLLGQTPPLKATWSAASGADLPTASAAKRLGSLGQ